MQTSVKYFESVKAFRPAAVVGGWGGSCFVVGNLSSLSSSVSYFQTSAKYLVGQGFVPAAVVVVGVG